MNRKRFYIVLLAVLFTYISLICVLVSQWVWLPDVIWPSEKRVGSLQLMEGEYIFIEEEWNDGDGYLLRLKHQLPDGSVASIVLDGDALKTWQCDLIKSNEGVLVTRNGRAYATYIPALFSSVQGGKRKAAAFEEPRKGKVGDMRDGP